MEQKKENFQIRDYFNHEIVKKISSNIKKHYKVFKKEEFEAYILSGLSALTYSERKEKFTSALEKFLPNNFIEASNILISILPPPYQTDTIEGENAMERFYVSSFTSFISKNGMADIIFSLDTLKTMTKSFTSEWDIRPFLLEHRQATLARLAIWAEDGNAHVRRLVSEGSRPYLPWGRKLKFVEENPDITISLLSKMKNDPSAYVRRSIANHLNDLSKKSPSKVVETLRLWRETNPSPELEKLISHALRTMIKAGQPGALKLQGYDPDIKLSIDEINCPTHVEMGKDLVFHFSLLSQERQKRKVVVDFAIHYIKNNGSSSPKVFKLKNIEIGGGEKKEFSKKVSFKPISTRKHYAGIHKIEVLANGNSLGIKEFDLIIA